MLAWFSTLLRTHRPGGRPPPTPHMTFPGIVLTADGFSFGVPDRPPVQARWSDIDGIATWKVDLVTYDDIRLVFHLVGDRWIEVSEEQPGFVELCEKMQKQFPSIPEGWYLDVMQRTFATNLRVLYRSHSPGA